MLKPSPSITERNTGRTCPESGWPCADPTLPVLCSSRPRRRSSGGDFFFVLFHTAPKTADDAFVRGGVRNTRACLVLVSLLLTPSAPAALSITRVFSFRFFVFNAKCTYSTLDNSCVFSFSFFAFDAKAPAALSIRVASNQAPGRPLHEYSSAYVFHPPYNSGIRSCFSGYWANDVYFHY